MISFFLILFPAIFSKKCLIFFDWDETLSNRGVMLDSRKRFIEDTLINIQNLHGCTFFVITAGTTPTRSCNQICKSLLPDESIFSITDFNPTIIQSFLKIAKAKQIIVKVKAEALECEEVYVLDDNEINVDIMKVFFEKQGWDLRRVIKVNGGEYEKYEHLKTLQTLLEEVKAEEHVEDGFIPVESFVVEEFSTFEDRQDSWQTVHK